MKNNITINFNDLTYQDIYESEIEFEKLVNKCFQMPLQEWDKFEKQYGKDFNIGDNELRHIMGILMGIKKRRPYWEYSAWCKLLMMLILISPL